MSLSGLVKPFLSSDHDVGELINVILEKISSFLAWNTIKHNDFNCAVSPILVFNAVLVEPLLSELTHGSPTLVRGGSTSMGQLPQQYNVWMISLSSRLVSIFP